MNKTIHYKINFLADWHCGSGMGSGMDVDNLVIKDANGLPFIPGKTIKGLVREAIEEIDSFRENKNRMRIHEVLGFFDGKENYTKGIAFFKNATLPKNISNEISTEHLQKHLFRTIASTAINEYGTAKEKSLRKIETVIPCELEGEVLDVPEDFIPTIEEGLRYIKRLGQNRNRGLGRCVITITQTSENTTEKLS